MAELTEFCRRLLNLCKDEEEFVEIYCLHIDEFSDFAEKLSIQLKCQIDMTLDSTDIHGVVKKLYKKIWRDNNA